jgi:hypothetical protein
MSMAIFGKSDILNGLWVEYPGDWAELYSPDGSLIWKGHPGDFEWQHFLGIQTKYVESIRDD